MVTPARLELLADRAPMNAQLGTDLAQGPALGVQVGCTLNVHGATVTSLSRIGFPETVSWVGSLADLGDGAALVHSRAVTITSFTQSHMSFPSSAMSLVGAEPMATTSWCSGTTAMS